MSIFLYSLFSGSGGNCCVVGDGETKMLVDVGVSARRIEQARFAPASQPSSLEQARTILADFDSLKALASLVAQQVLRSGN